MVPLEHSHLISDLPPPFPSISTRNAALFSEKSKKITTVHILLRVTDNFDSGCVNNLISQIASIIFSSTNTQHGIHLKEGLELNTND